MKNPKTKENKCDICGDTNSSNYAVWHSTDKYNNTKVCSKHYAQIRRHNKFLDDIPSTFNQKRICCVCGFEDHSVVYSKRYKGMYCLRHYSQLYKLGEIKKITVFDKNEYYIHDGVVYLILRNSKNENVAEVKLDEEDLEKVLQFKWYLDTWGYAESHIKGLMQRFILNEYDSNRIPDHINRDRLDNRKSNLRILDKSGNSVNSGLRSNNKSGVTGVSWNKSRSSWRSYINYQGKRIELGQYKDITDAIIARLSAENKYYPGMQPQINLFERYRLSPK